MITKFIHYFAGIVLFFAGIGLFTIKERVSLLNYQLTEVNKQINIEKDKIHALKAEYAYLNNPDRLRSIAENYLNLSNIKSTQLIKDPLHHDIRTTQIACSDKEGIKINIIKATQKWRYKKMPSKYAHIHTVSARVQ